MQETIYNLEQIIIDYTPQLKLINEEGFSFRSAPDKWSRKELLGHLIDSAQNNIRRFVVAQYEDKPLIVYAQDKWVKAAGYQNYAVSELIDLWILLNKHLLVVLRNLPSGIEKREVLTQDLHSIKWLADDYNKHLLHHLHQVLNLDAVAYP